MPALLTQIESLLEKHALSEEEIIIRMTGCPNGCARSYAAEIGFVGTGPGRYNLQIGGDRLGERLNKLFRENIGEDEILRTLDHLFKLYAEGRKGKETFGDFALRQQIRV
jgi:sulfite reductase (NADPH) hemoprotein beta-component